MITFFSGFAVLGAAWRFFDGAGLPRITWLRNLAGWAICMLAAMTAFSDIPLSIWAGSWIALGFIQGFDDWNRWGNMAGHFVITALAAMGPALFLGLPWWIAFGYVGIASLAGLSYPLLIALDRRWSLPTWRLIDGPEAYARVTSAGLLIGSLSILTKLS
jgi:hypothetical protein